MPYIPDVKTNDQISSSGWGNLIRNATVIHFATLAERNTYTGVAATDQICYVSNPGEFYIKSATGGWLTMFSTWRAYNPVAFTNQGGTTFQAWAVPGQGSIQSSYTLNASSYARYRVELDTCYFQTGVIFAVQWFGPPGQGDQTAVQVYLPDNCPMAVNNVPCGSGVALAQWNSAGTLRNKWMGGTAFAQPNSNLVSGANQFNGAYLTRIQEDVTAAANVRLEAGGAGYIFPGVFDATHQSAMYVEGSYQMTGLIVG